MGMVMNFSGIFWDGMALLRGPLGPPYVRWRPLILTALTLHPKFHTHPNFVGPWIARIWTALKPSKVHLP